MATDWLAQWRERKAEHEAAVTRYESATAAWRQSSWDERQELEAELTAAFDARNAASTAREQAWIQVKLHRGAQPPPR